MFINYTFNLYRIYFPSLNRTNQLCQVTRSGPQKSRDILMPPLLSRLRRREKPGSDLTLRCGGDRPEVTPAPQHP